MPSEELEKQVAAERKEIENAPTVPLSQLRPTTSGTAGRCNWCGRISPNLEYVDTIHGVDRYKGVCCARTAF